MLSLLFVAMAIVQPQNCLAQAAESESQLTDSTTSMTLRTDQLEQEVFGSVSHSPLQKRLDKLEKTTFGKRRDGSLASRLNQLSTAIKGESTKGTVSSVGSSTSGTPGSADLTATAGKDNQIAAQSLHTAKPAVQEPDRLFEGEQFSVETNQNDKALLKGRVHDTAIDDLLRQPATTASDFSNAPYNGSASQSSNAGQYAQAAEADGHARMSAAAQELQARAKDEARQSHARKVAAFKHGLSITLKTAAVVAVTAAVVYAASSSGGGGMLAGRGHDVCGCHHFRGF